MTFGDVLGIRALGALSALDFAATAEAVIGQPQPRADPDLVLQLVDAPWADMISEEDPRFVDLLRWGRGTLLQRLDAVTTSGQGLGEDTTVAALAASLPRMQERIAALERLPLDAAIRQYVAGLSGCTGQRLEALLERTGWGPTPKATLEAASHRIGVTRERLRQIEARARGRRPRHRVYMPALDRALDAIVAASPLEPEGAADLLVSHGISTIPYLPENVLEAAELCGVPAAFTIDVIQGKRWISTSPLRAMASKVVSMAARRANKFGATNLADVVAALDQAGVQCDAQQVRSALESYSEAVFVSADWFWVPGAKEGRNRLVNVARAVLSVASPVDVAEIREAARRRYRFRGLTLVPPKAVMQEFFRTHPEFAVDPTGMVSHRTPLDYRRELGAGDQVLVEVLRSVPTGILDRSSFAERSVARGLNVNTFNILTSYSSILQHVDLDMWALRGVRVDPAAVQAMREALALRPQRRVIEDHGWTADGQIWLAIRVPKVWEGRVVGVPAAIASYVAGRRFPAHTVDGAAAGLIVVNESGSAWGFGPFLGRSGADEGDYLMLKFDIVNEKCEIAVGGQEVLEAVAQPAEA